MKIVKEFVDFDYYHSPGVRPTGVRKPDATWFWGLGEDGQLYYKYIPSYTDQWQLYQTIANQLPMPVSQMKKIVKEFGHLLVWL